MNRLTRLVYFVSRDGARFYRDHVRAAGGLIGLQLVQLIVLTHALPQP